MILDEFNGTAPAVRIFRNVHDGFLLLTLEMHFAFRLFTFFAF